MTSALSAKSLNTLQPLSTMASILLGEVILSHVKFLLERGLEEWGAEFTFSVISLKKFSKDDNTYRTAAMESKKMTTPAEDAMNLVNTVSSIVKFFIERLTHQQWIQLKSGAPDYATKLMLVEMILEIIISASTILEECTDGVQSLVSEEGTHSTLNDGLQQSLEDLLGTPDQVSSASSNQFVHLLSAEIAENVNSAPRSSSPRSRRNLTCERITPPDMIDAMVESGCKVFKDFADKAEVVCHARSGWWKREDPVVEVCQDQDKVASEDSFVGATSKVAQNLIREKVHDLIEPLFDGKALEYQLLLNKTSEDIQDIASEVTSIMEEDLNIHAPQMKFSSFQETARRKLKKFFSLTIFKALIQRKFSQMRGKFDWCCGAQKSQSLEKLLERISSPVPIGEQQEGNELSDSCAKNSGSMKAFIDSLPPLLPGDEMGNELSASSATENQSMEILFESISNLLLSNAQQEGSAHSSSAENDEPLETLDTFVDSVLSLTLPEEEREGNELLGASAENCEALESLDTFVDSILSVTLPEEEQEGNELLGSSAEQSEPSETLLESILILLQSDQQQEGNELSVAKTLKDISSGEVTKFTSALTNLLYEHATDETITTLRGGPDFRTEAQSFLYADIQKKVWMFVVIMNWWEKTQGDTHSQMVTLALTGTEEEIEVVTVPQQSSLGEPTVSAIRWYEITVITAKEMTSNERTANEITAMTV